MALKYCFALTAALAAIHGTAFAEGTPRDGAGSPAAAVAAEHRHGDHGQAQAAPEPGVPADPGRGRRQGQEWTKYPLITPVMRPDAGRDRMGAVLAVKNLETGALEVFAPKPGGEGVGRPFPVTPEGAEIKALPKLGNYYWVVAREEKDGRVGVASTAYYFSEPGPAPTELLKVRKSELEIIPQPLPREHGAYREAEKWRFLVRFNGQPLPHKPVKMETEFGTKTVFTSDAKGMVTVLFPYDFKPAAPEHGRGHHGPRRAKFVLAAEHDDQGRHYHTAFNYTYSPDDERTRNLWAGVGFGVFGMLLATPLLRRKKVGGNA
jgi:hypothetical protein